MLVRDKANQSMGGIEPRRILIFVPNWVGDVVMATAAMRAIRRHFQGAHIVHLMKPYVADVLSGTGLSDEQFFWPARPDSQHSGRLGLIGDLRRRRFDLAVLLTNSFRSALIARLAGVERRVGYARDARGWLLTDRLRPLRQGRRFVPVPALDYYNDLARYLGCEEVEDRLALATSMEDESSIDKRLGSLDPEQPLVVLNPGANYGSGKCWPAEKYAALADAVVSRYGARVVASLGPKERAIADRLQAAANRPIEVYVDPPLGLGPLRALIRRCHLLVTNDTGPRHFAAAFDVPVVTIFGSSDPAWTETRFGKERVVKLDLDCQPCMARVCPLGHHDCMQKLEPDLVLEKVDEFLGMRQTGSEPGRLNVVQ
ncbi:MAG: lipopolysaccharide heptosyltransferase II [Phycisphaerales bacterium]|nr:lipopolysaccharide heptosyltransferase II [Phycisphaerales bacterium]